MCPAQCRAADSIVVRLGVHSGTVYHYLQGMKFYPARRHEARNPLFDPVRDGVAAQTVTAMLCGDPLPGRRELVANHNRPKAPPISLSGPPR
jgi:hypothetical protein